jgi:small GTP-binding protein
MTNKLQYDVFLSYSSRDKDIVRDVAGRLKTDGVQVWFDEWEIWPGDSIPSKIEDGLKQSHILLFFMSINAFGSDWTELESQTFRFRDPLNKERRFIPIRLDNTPIEGSLEQIYYIDWCKEDSRQKEYEKLMKACQPTSIVRTKISTKSVPAEKTIQLDSEKTTIWTYAFNPDKKCVLTGDTGNNVILWDLETGKRLRKMQGHTNFINSISYSFDKTHALSGSHDKTVRVWDIKTKECLMILEGHTGAVRGAVSCSQNRVLSCSEDKTLRLWDIDTGDCLHIFEGHSDHVVSIALSPDKRYAISASTDNTVCLWDIEAGHCIHVLKGHSEPVLSLAWSSDKKHVISGSQDATLRLWNIETGHCLHVLEGHTKDIWTVAWNADHNFALSGSSDKTLRLWDMETKHCLCVLEDHETAVQTVAWSADGSYAFSGDSKGNILSWNLSKFINHAKRSISSSEDEPDQVQYTNAKVLLVGNTSVGKTGLSNRLVKGIYKKTDSTSGAWATQWKMPLTLDSKGTEKEIWLWDFGGQADQRLIHQMYMDNTQLAVLVFDPQRRELFEDIEEWDRDLKRATTESLKKLLVAGRVDVGGLLRHASIKQVERFAQKNNFCEPFFIKTSAKRNTGCDELKDAIINSIPWNEIELRTSPTLYKRLKDEIISLKDEGRTLIRFNELRDTLTLRLNKDKENWKFSDDELQTVIGLLASPGVVWELGFGSWILLQPEMINACAQAVICTMDKDEKEMGCISEVKVLRGHLSFPESLKHLPQDEKRLLLLAMHMILMKRGLCLREESNKEDLLVFPSYTRVKMPEQMGKLQIIVSYQFDGFLDDIYATLVIRLHYTKGFELTDRWNRAADFKTSKGKQIGVRMIRKENGRAKLLVYSDPDLPEKEKVSFAKYIHDHLLQKAKDVVRLRHYICPDPRCARPVRDRELAMEQLEEWKKYLKQYPANNGLAGWLKSLIDKRKTPPTIFCNKCRKRVPLYDDLEKCFASSEIKEQVEKLEKRSYDQLDNESKERTLVGDVISTVALAGQISRELTVSDHGIDMEIEFKNDAGEAIAKKVYLQLKSGDSYLRERKSDGSEIFTIQKERHIRYWMEQQFPVLLVIRNSNGEVRWMEIRDWLKQKTDNGRKPIKQIVFEGKRFDVMSVRKLREQLLTKQ